MGWLYHQLWYPLCDQAQRIKRQKEEEEEEDLHQMDVSGKSIAVPLNPTL